MVAGMIKEFPELLEVRPKRLKAVVKYLWKVRRRNRRRPDVRARRQRLFLGVRCKGNPTTSVSGSRRVRAGGGAGNPTEEKNLDLLVFTVVRYSDASSSGQS